MPSNKTHSFVKVGTASPRVKVADCSYNSSQIIELLKQAESEKISVLVFPELSISSYTCADLFQHEVLLNSSLESLAQLVEASNKFSGLFFVGLPLVADDQLFNCAVAINQGRILGVVPKLFIPNYKEFYERRWFSSGNNTCVETINLFGEEVPFGKNLLFQSNLNSKLIVGVEICEDLWVPIPPSSYQALAGATILVNLSASNELIGKSGYRRQLVSNQSARCVAAYAYASCGTGESSTDILFSGHCLISENGTTLAENKRFERENVLISTEIDLERIMVDRIRLNSFADNKRESATEARFRKIPFRDPNHSINHLTRFIDAHPFVPQGRETLAERCNEIFHIQVSALCKRIERIGGSSLAIGVSGGLDSTLSLLVLCKALDQLKIPRTRIEAFTLPGFGTTGRTKNNALALMDQLGIRSREVDIRQLCLDEFKALKHNPFGIAIDTISSLDDLSSKLSQLPENSQDLVFENVQARMRTSILMNAGFVVGTGDLSELALGWCTYNADHMSMYNPNASIPKTLVKFLVDWAADFEFDDQARKTLKDIVATEISPELLPPGKDGQISQKTESNVGPYELNDFILFHVLRFGMSPEKIFFLAQQASFHEPYSRDDIAKWLKLFFKRFFANQFKRSCLPDGPKVGSVSLSPRGDWRMPSDAQAEAWLAWNPEDTLDSVQPKESVSTRRLT